MTLNNTDNSHPSVLTARDNDAFTFEYPMGTPLVRIEQSGEIQGKIWYSKEYTWNAGESSQKMEPADKCVCFLTYVRGKFEGGGERVFTYIRNGYWYLGGAEGGAGQDIRAKARCIGMPY